MGKLKWYKRDPVRALKGMMQLTLEQRGAYNTVLDLIYSHDNQLRDDDHFIAGWCRVDIRIWRRIKTLLIDCGKLYVDNGFLRNATADVEALDALHRVLSASDAAHQAWATKRSKSAPVSNENKDLFDTAVDAPVIPAQMTPTTTKNSKKRDSGFSGGKAKGPQAVTIQDPGERLARFQKNLAEEIGSGGYAIIAAVNDPTNPLHTRSVKLCRDATRRMNKRWPTQWKVSEEA